MRYSSKTVVFGVLGALGALSFVLSVIAWHTTSSLFLPLPTALPAMGTLLPLLLFAISPSISSFLLRTRTRSSRAAAAQKNSTPTRNRLYTSLIVPLLNALLTILPTAIATLALTYLVPGDVLTCRLETQWQAYFHRKNERAIRAIQDGLRCCGLRSVHDRAWPFKDGSKGYGDDECERRFGYGRSCLALWRGEEQRVAGMVFVAAAVVLAVKIGLFYTRRRVPWMNGLDINEETDDHQRMGIDGRNPRMIGYSDRDEEANSEVREEANGGENHARPLLSETDAWSQNNPVQRHNGGGFGGPAVHPSGLGATGM